LYYVKLGRYVSLLKLEKKNEKKIFEKKNRKKKIETKLLKKIF